MKKVFTLLLCSVAAFCAQAQTYGYLKFKTSDGTVQPFAVSNLTLTLSGSNLIVTNGTDSQTFALADLTMMYFSTTTSIGPSPKLNDSKVEVFNLKGVRQGQYENLEAAKKVLKRGVYVVKQGSKTFKVTQK